MRQDTFVLWVQASGRAQAVRRATLLAEVAGPVIAVLWDDLTFGSALLPVPPRFVIFIISETGCELGVSVLDRAEEIALRFLDR